MLKPLRQWIAVERLSSETVSPLWIPPGIDAAGLDSRLGKVIALGEGRITKRAAKIGLGLKTNDRVVYSSRVDSYRASDLPVDIIEDQSIIGIML